MVIISSRLNGSSDTRSLHVFGLIANNCKEAMSNTLPCLRFSWGILKDKDKIHRVLQEDYIDVRGEYFVSDRIVHVSFGILRCLCKLVTVNRHLKILL